VNHKTQPGASSAGNRRCSIRVLSDGNSIVIGNGSGSSAPRKPSPSAEATNAVPQLRRTKVFRLDQLPRIEKA
jgi:hypothetical protein